MSVAALIPAAGSGERLGLGPKALVRLPGGTLLRYAIDACLGVADQVVVAVPGQLQRALASEFPEAKVVAGGASRQETVRRLLEATQAEFVLVHDAARPFLERAVAVRVLEAARSSGAATAAIRISDALVTALDGQAIDREPLRAVQTPQAFARELLAEAHERARREGREALDDAALVRALGHTVTLVEGSSWLLKVTTPADLELARALAATWAARKAGA